MASTNTEGEPTAASAEGEPACMHAFGCMCVCVCVFVCASERVYVSVFECKWPPPTQRVSRQR